MAVEIKLKDIEVYAYHGVYDFEQKQGQKFLISCDIVIADTLFDDCIKNSIDYTVIAKVISEFSVKNRFNLIESLANELCLELVKNFNQIDSVNIKIKKPDAVFNGSKLKDVQVAVQRKRAAAYIGLGSNLGDKQKNIDKAIQKLDNLKGVKVLKKSDFLEFKPYGKLDQPDFLNGAVKIGTFLTPKELLNELLKIEKELGRVRDKQKWAARELDLDILFYDNLIINDSDLTIPHYDLHNRLFVLAPLNSIAKNFIHPVLNKSVSEILNAVNTQ